MDIVERDLQRCIVNACCARGGAEARDPAGETLLDSGFIGRSFRRLGAAG